MNGIELTEAFLVANTRYIPGRRLHLIKLEVRMRESGGAYVSVCFEEYPSKELVTQGFEIEPGAFRMLREQLTLAR